MRMDGNRLFVSQRLEFREWRVVHMLVGGGPEVGEAR